MSEEKQSALSVPDPKESVTALVFRLVLVLLQRAISRKRGS